MRFSKNVFTTFTVSVASPALFTCTDHELAVGDVIWLETTGALPTGLSVRTKYYVVRDGYTVNTFRVATSDDEEATPVNTSGTQSGTHTFIKYYRARLTPKVHDTK